jgi:Na+-transporting NADH:ubiquinone oxidoreductase subunit NqrC
VQAGKLKQVSILTFRESRGGEVRYPAFTDQFPGAALKNDHHLDRSIDGISGATLSVRAVEKTARIALFLHQQTPFAHVSTQ